MKISVRQICFIMIIYTTVSKLLLYPSALVYFSGRDLLFSAAIDFLIQGIVIWSVAYACSKTDTTFFQLLQNTFGKVVPRIIYGLFGLFFIISAVYPLIEQKLYVHTIFYETVPSLWVFLPVFFFTVYAGAKGFTNIGRCADLCLPIFIVSFFCIILMSFGESCCNAVLPIMKTPVSKIFTGSAATFFRFAEPSFLIMFMGHFKYKKHDALKITISYALGALLVLGFLLLFYTIFSDLAVTRRFAISKISVFFSAINIIGRIDLIALYAMEIVMLFAFTLNVQLAVDCIGHCVGEKFKKRLDDMAPAIISLAVNAVLFGALIGFGNRVSLLNKIYSQYMPIVFLVFTTVLPFLVWTLKKKKKEIKVEDK